MRNFSESRAGSSVYLANGWFSLIRLTEDWVALKSKPNQRLDVWTRGLSHAIAQLRAIGEHPFRILKHQFGYTKVRYRGLVKSVSQLHVSFALGNPYQVGRALLASGT